MATRNEPPFLLSPLILSCRRTDVAQVLNLNQEPLAGAGLHAKLQWAPAPLTLDIALFMALLSALEATLLPTAPAIELKIDLNIADS